ncbi:hypothetical protein JOE67_001421 [Microbacterium esteraromaticum]|nr:hypothetical protein [Microbacterium esteraromaticum]MBM7465829.1 hypothetical protein [Microbacterium esteraromaticum]
MTFIMRLLSRARNPDLGGTPPIPTMWPGGWGILAPAGRPRPC